MGNCSAFMIKLPAHSPAGCARILLSICLIFVLGSAFAQRPLGTDVSGYQPAIIDWTTVKNAGVKFAWSKATEGTGYVNPNFTAQVAGAAAAGIYIGAYHYARPQLHPNLTGVNSADSEAAYFWSVAGPYIKYGGSYFMPMLDWEDVNATVAAGFTAAQMSAWVNEWCNAVSNTAYGSGVVIQPVVYTGTWYSVPGSTYPGLTTDVTNRPCCISGYPTNPNPQTGSPGSTFPWPSFNFWQYADTNWSGGDSDVYNGTLAGLLKNFVIGGTNAPSISGNPANVTLAPLGDTATLSVRASGQAPLSFQWLFNGAVIPGATSSNYTIANVQWGNVGSYVAVVSNSYGPVPSSAGYITLLTNAPGSIVAPSSLVDWWPAEGTPVDIFGGKTGTATGGFSYAAGRTGRAFHFDGSTSYLTTGASSLSVPWTACVWVNRQNAPGTGAALLGDGNVELKLEQYNGTRQVGFTRFGVADYNFGYTVPLSTWTHLAFVASGTQMQLYANGSLVATLTTNIPLPRAYFGVGYVNNGGSFVDYMLGSVDEVMMFNRALSSTEISAIAAAGSAGVVRVPEFTAIQPLGNNQVRMNLRGLTGKNIKVYASQDLDNWTLLGSLANPTGNVLYTDNSATNAVGFYRAAQ